MAVRAVTHILTPVSACLVYGGHFLQTLTRPNAMFMFRAANCRRAHLKHSRAACSLRDSGGEKALIVDTDMGPDDIAAIALLAFYKVPIHLVTTVHGVCEDRLAAQLARRIASALNLCGVNIVSGASTPLSGDEFAPPTWMIERRIQLADFNARSKLPEDTSPEHRPSVDAAAEAILEAARGAKHPATVLALGPLSNVARAVEKDPASFRRNVGLVIVAGESSKPGRSLCFNGRLDLEALEALIHAQAPLIFVGGNSRMRSGDFYALLGSYELSGSVAAYLISEMSKMRPDSIVDDPTAAYYILCPDMFDCEKVDVFCDARARQFCRVNVAPQQNGSSAAVLEAKSSNSTMFVQLLRAALVTPTSM